MTLDQARKMAKDRYANPTGIAVAIYNFNSYMPHYVIRDISPDQHLRREFVEQVDPD